MSNPSDHGSWNPPGHDADAQQPPSNHLGDQGVSGQDPWAQPQGDQQYGEQNPYGQAPQGDQQYGDQNPYGRPPSDGKQPQGVPQQPAGQDPFEQPSSQDPYGQASGASASDPYGQASGASASDPYAQSSGPSASDPYGQGQQNWSPAGGSVPAASDPYTQPASGAQPSGAAYGQQGYGQQNPGPGPAGTSGGQAQSRLVVGLLGIFLGGFGVHRFLMGYTTIGIIQIVVTIFTCGIGAWWGVIEGIMVLAKSQTFERDAHGRPLTD